ncbi:MAG TPA: DUF6683 family protein [Pyrinomonadaceae bacterium]|nr:DUF6683 family protein [Pyrinomonadaceae bacterium]
MQKQKWRFAVMRMKISCLWLLMVLGISMPAVAQHGSDSLGGIFQTPSGAKITNTIVDSIALRNRNRAAKRVRATPSARTSGTTPAESSAPAAKPSDGSVLFRPTGTQLKTRELANLIDAGNPQIVKLLTTLLEEFDKGAKAAGHPNDLALALSFFFATNASLYHGGGPPPDPPMVELRDTIAGALSERKTLSSMSDRQKQEMYETLVLLTGFALAVYEEGNAGNAESLKVSRQLAGEYLLAVTGISPDKISFTDQGLSIEKATEAGVETSTKTNADTSSPADPGPSTLSNSDFLEFDPFPDKPYVQPQKPLVGRLRKTITMADLAGTWEIGGASVTTYVSSGTNTYTDASFFGKKYFVRGDGAYSSKFQGRASNTTIRETDSGTILLSGGFITMKSRQNPAMRYQFVAFMNQANGAAVLSLIYIGDGAPLDANALRANCGHGNGYVSCLNGEEWVRIP